MDDDKRACAEYFATMCDQLAQLAKKNGFSFGAYLLAMAAIEFASQKNTFADYASKDVDEPKHTGSVRSLTDFDGSLDGVSGE